MLEDDSSAASNQLVFASVFRSVLLCKIATREELIVCDFVKWEKLET